MSEEQLHEAHRAGDLTLACSLTVQLYGPEVLGFLNSRLSDLEAANDAFGHACESLCSTIAEFEWRCSMRTWFYKLARTAASRSLRSPANRHEAHIPLSQVSEIADRVRTQTKNYLRTEVKDRFAQLRDDLDPDDRSLLILRVDRALDWKEIALVMTEGEPQKDEHAQIAARLRQRFQTVKKRLRERAVEDGLL